MGVAEKTMLMLPCVVACCCCCCLFDHLLGVPFHSVNGNSWAQLRGSHHVTVGPVVITAEATLRSGHCTCIWSYDPHVQHPRSGHSAFIWCGERHVQHLHSGHCAGLWPREPHQQHGARNLVTATVTRVEEAPGGAGGAGGRAPPPLPSSPNRSYLCRVSSSDSTLYARAMILKVSESPPLSG